MQLGIDRPLKAAAVVPPVLKPPDIAACTKRGDSDCGQSMPHYTPRLHGGCLVSVVMVDTAAARLSIIMAAAPCCRPGV